MYQISYNLAYIIPISVKYLFSTAKIKDGGYFDVKDVMFSYYD